MEVYWKRSSPGTGPKDGSRRAATKSHREDKIYASSKGDTSTNCDQIE